MDTTTALLIAIPVLIVLAGVLLFAAARRRDTGEAIGLLTRETRKRDRGTIAPDPEAPPATGREVERAAAIERREPSKELVTTGARTPAAWVPPDPDQLAVTRRQFMNRGIVTFMSLGLLSFATACIAFLWPKQGGGFGSQIPIGSTTDVDAQIADGQGFAYYPNGRMWVTKYPAAALANARSAYASAPGVLTGMEAGFVALYQKCPHLGCRVPECVTSQWFECPCHGSQYNQVGEKKGGPAPRGMDRFSVAADGGNIVVDTGTIIQGPPIGTNTTGQEAEGPHCISGGEH